MLMISLLWNNNSVKLEAPAVEAVRTHFWITTSSGNLFRVPRFIFLFKKMDDEESSRKSNYFVEQDLNVVSRPVGGQIFIEFHRKFILSLRSTLLQPYDHERKDSSSTTYFNVRPASH